MKLKGLKVINTYESDEPQSCEYHGCKEELNGLNHLCIFPFEKFCFDIWLCDEHLKLFERKLREMK